MGTKVALSLANIFMAGLGEKFVYACLLQPLFWAQYIDDILYTWQHGDEELKKFHDHLNSCHRTIKFSHETSMSQIDFLDITININKHIR